MALQLRQLSPTSAGRAIRRPARLQARAAVQAPPRHRSTTEPSPSSLLAALPRAELVRLLQRAGLDGQGLQAENARLRKRGAHAQAQEGAAQRALGACRAAQEQTERHAKSAWTSFCGAKHQLLAAQDALSARETQVHNLKREVRQLQYATAAQGPSASGCSAHLL